MHHISKITIKNFKSISTHSFALSPYTPLVGYNNAGKTNILRSINWLINRSVLDAKDFNDPACPVEVEAEISGVTGDVLAALARGHRERIEPLVQDGKIRIRRIQTAPGVKIAAVILTVYQGDQDPGVWGNPAGIDAAISALFPECIFIGAMENAAEDVAKNGSSTTIGKLLKEIMDPVIARHSAAVNEALADIGSKLSARGDHKDETLVGLDQKIHTELTKLFPGVSAKTHIPVPEFSDFLKAATIQLFDEGYENVTGRDVSSFGHGAQRSIQIALLKVLAEVRRQGELNNSRTTLLLIDEPELYLHPQAIAVVRGALKKLEDNGYQVIFTTHSGSMISHHDAANALLVRRSAAAGTTALPRLKDTVTAALVGADFQVETLFELTNSIQILFSETVVIAEGVTEKTILPAIFQRERNMSFDEAKIGLIELGGANNLHNSRKVLQAMGVPCKMIVDLDYMFKNAPRKGLIAADNPDIAQCKQILLRLKNDGEIELGNDGWAVNRPNRTAEQTYELLCQQNDAQPLIARLHEALKAQNVWVWKRGAIEAYLGIEKTGAARANFVSSINEQGFVEACPDYAGLIELIAWLQLPDQAEGVQPAVQAPVPQHQNLGAPVELHA